MGFSILVFNETPVPIEPDIEAVLNKLHFVHAADIATQYFPFPWSLENLKLELGAGEYLMLYIFSNADSLSRAFDAQASLQRALSTAQHREKAAKVGCSLPMVLLKLSCDNEPAVEEHLNESTASAHFTASKANFAAVVEGALMAALRPIKVEHVPSQQAVFWAFRLSVLSTTQSTLIAPADVPLGEEGIVIRPGEGPLGNVPNFDAGTIIFRSCSALPDFDSLKGCYWNCEFSLSNGPLWRGVLFQDAFRHLVLFQPSNSSIADPFELPSIPHTLPDVGSSPSKQASPKKAPLIATILTSTHILKDARFEICTQFGELIDLIRTRPGVPRGIEIQFKDLTQRLKTCAKGNSIKVFPGASDPLNRHALYTQLFTEIRDLTTSIPSKSGNLFKDCLKVAHATLKDLRKTQTKRAAESQTHTNEPKKPKGADFLNLPVRALATPASRASATNSFVARLEGPEKPDDPVVMPVLEPYLVVEWPAVKAIRQQLCEHALSSEPLVKAHQLALLYDQEDQYCRSSRLGL